MFVNRNYVGGCDDTYAAQESGKLSEHLKAAIYDYDLIVIGGGSGGLAASKVSRLRCLFCLILIFIMYIFFLLLNFRKLLDWVKKLHF